MAKKKDLLSYLNIEDTENKTPVLLSQEDIDKQSGEASSLFSKDYSKYKDYLSQNGQPVYDSPETWDEKRALNQSGTEKVLNSVGQMTGTFGTALASGIAALGSGVVALGAEAVTGGEAKGMDIFLNNPIMKGINDLDKYIKEDLLPTYYTKEQQESIFSAATGTDLLNGIGFMASAIVPNAAIGKLFGSWSRMAAIAKAGKLPAILAAAEEAGTLTNVERKLLSTFATHLDKAGPIVGGVVGRIGESAMEASQTYDQIKESRKAERDAAIQELQMYGETEHPELINLTDNQIEQEALNGRNNVFGGNMALAISDISQYTRWFKGGGLGERLTKEGLKTVVKDRGKKEILGELIKESAQEAGEEGFQFLLSKGAENQARYGTSFAKGIQEASGDLFTTVEGQKSMLLGAVLGGGMSSIAAAANTKKTKAALTQMANELTAAGDTSQRYITDPETGKRIVNPELSKIATTFAFYEQQKEKALEAGDKDAYDVAEKMQFSQLVAAKIKAGQFDEFIDELQNMGTVDAEEIKAMFGELPTKNGKEMSPAEVAFEKIQLAKRVKQMTEGFEKLPGMEKLGPAGMNIAKHMLFTQESLRDQLKTKDEKIAEIQSRAVYNPLPVENGEGVQDNLLPQDRAELVKVQKEKEILLKEYKDISDVFKEIVAKPEKAQEKADKIQEESIKNAVETESENLKKDAKDLAESKGKVIDVEGAQYIVDEPFSENEIKLEYDPHFKQSEDQQRLKKEKELEEAFNGGKKLAETPSGQKVRYKGKDYFLTKDPIENVLQLEDPVTGQVIDIQQDEEFGYDAPLYYYGIEEINDNPITDLIDIATVDGVQVITIDGKVYTNLYSNPLAAINYDADGNIVSVSLNANDKNQSPRTFKKYAEEIAYAILLDTYNQLNNENQEAKRKFAEKLKSTDVTNESKGEEQIPSPGDTEETEKIEAELSAKEEAVRKDQKELEDFNSLLEIALMAETSEELLSYKDELSANKYYNKSAIKKLNDKFQELKFNETQKDVTQGTIITKEELLGKLQEENAEDNSEFTDDTYTKDDVSTQKGEDANEGYKKPTLNATSGQALTIEGGQRVIVDGENELNPEFIDQTKLFNDPTISNDIVKEPGETPNTITFKAEKGTISADQLRQTNARRISKGLAPLTEADFENSDYFPITLTLMVNGVAKNTVKSFYHNIDYYESTAEYEKIQYDKELSDAAKEALHAKNIAMHKATRAKLVNSINANGAVVLATNGKSPGILNYNPKVTDENGVEFRKTNSVIGILAKNFEELLNGVKNAYYSVVNGKTNPINTKGIQIVTATERIPKSTSYIITVQTNTGQYKFVSEYEYGVGSMLFDFVAPNGDVVTTSPFTKNSLSVEQINALTDLIMLKLSGESIVNVDGKLYTIAGTESVPGILDSLLYVGAVKSKEADAIATQLFFTKDGQIQLGKKKYPADTENLAQIIKDHLNNYKSRPHFKFKSIEAFGNNFGIPVKKEDGTFEIKKSTTYMDFLFGGEKPLISTALNQTKFVNSYFNLVTDNGGKPINEVKTEVKVEETKPTEAKKADIEKRRQEELKEFDDFVKKEDGRRQKPLDEDFIKNTISKVNAKYDAELAALETKPKEQVESIEDKIDNIERRRQEELNKKSTQGTLKNSPLDDIPYYENKVAEAKKRLDEITAKEGEFVPGSDRELGSFQGMLNKAKKKIDDINAKYDKEIEDLETKPEEQVEKPVSEVEQTENECKGSTDGKPAIDLKNAINNWKI